jgi:hypothetical protein
MANKILIKRGTREQINLAATPGNSLSLGELYLITDEGRLAVGTGSNTYQDFLKANEAAPLDADLTAIAALSGTSGVLRKDAANTWSLDTNTFITVQAPNFNQTNGATFAGTSGSIKLAATAASVTGTLLLPSGGGTLATTSQIPTVGSGGLTLDIGAAAATNNSVTVLTGTGFTANSSSGSTYSISVGPALNNLASIMTGAGTTGLLRKDGQDTYTLVNPNTFYASTTRLDQIVAPTASVDFNSQKITGLAEPTLAQDAATKNYVDTVAQGLDTKASVRAATTTNITLSGTQTIDGVDLIVNDRVLVKNQTTNTQNGIYVVAAGAWSRAADANTTPELVSAFTFVEEGTVNADTGWVSTFNPGDAIGSSAVIFVQFSAAGAYTAGTGMTATGNTFNVIGTADRITANANSIDIASTYAGQTSIVTLGEVTTGTWSATAIGATKGGTGQTAFATGDILYASGANTLSKLTKPASLDSFLQMTSAGVPSWVSTIDGGTF